MLTNYLVTDEQDMPSLYEASMSVDALVADIIDFPSRSSTPSVPPGFSGLPYAHPPPLALDEDTVRKPQSRIDPTSATFTPSHISSHAPRVATPLSNVFVPPTSTQVLTSAQGHGRPKQDRKPSSSANDITRHAVLQSLAASPISATLQPEDFPALESSKTKPAPQTASTMAASSVKVAISTTTSKKTLVSTSGTTTAPTSASKISEKRLLPGLTNISVPFKPTSGTSDGVVKPVISSAVFPPLSASTPSSAPLQSPTARGGQAKVLRLASTPRAETPTALATPSSMAMQAPLFPPSRQPSLASMSKNDRPGTPTSEITDNASTTSAPLSRANSPPPSKIGSAPLRATTKSMQKKQRAQKAKEREISVAAPVEPEPEPEIAPIQGRKKKQRKEKATGGTAGGSTPAASRPPSPRPNPEATNQNIEPLTERSHPAETIDKPALENDLDNRVQDLKGKGKAKAQPPTTPEPVSATTEVEEETTDKRLPTPSSVLQALISSKLIDNGPNLSILRPPHVNSRIQEPQTDLENAIPKLSITPDDRATLLSGQPVHKNTQGPSRIMLTPNGDCVRNLTPEEEDRYLELQSRIAQESGPTAFFSAKHHAGTGFTLIGGRAVPNGPPTFFPQSTSTTTPLDPVSKIQRDEALSYINQYVLPSLSANSQLEKALNANALDTEIIRGSEPSAWAPWSTDRTSPRSESTDVVYPQTIAQAHDGILATGLEGITAHFAVGRDIDRGKPLGNVTLLSLRDAETAIQAAKKETEVLEKKLNALLKKNRRLLLGSGN